MSDTSALTELDLIFQNFGGNEAVEKSATAYENTPDGIYTAEVISGEFMMSKSDLPMIVISYGIEGIAKPHKQFLMLANAKGQKETEQTLNRTINNLRKLGLDGKTVTEYVEQLDTLIGKQVELTISTHNGYTNTYIKLI